MAGTGLGPWKLAAAIQGKIPYKVNSRDPSPIYEASAVRVFLFFQICH